MRAPVGIQAQLKSFLIEIGEMSLFTARFFRELFKRPFEFKEILRQSYYMGNKSLLLVAVTSFIIGLVMTLQTRPTLMEFGAVSWMPSMVGISIVREIGPIIIALVCAGKIGSGIGAELGSMRVTEQIDAMRALGTNPYKKLASTRFIALTVMLPILVVIGDLCGMIGGWLVAVTSLGISTDYFWSHAIHYLFFSDIFLIVSFKN